MTAVQKQEERADRLLKSATDRDITEEESCVWLKDCKVGRNSPFKHRNLGYKCVNSSSVSS